MSKRRKIERRLRSYSEIADIMNAMKNLAMIETLKLTRCIGHQRRVVATTESAAQDFMVFYGHLLAGRKSGHHVYLAIGTERGFCGNLNEALLPALEREWTAQGPGAVVVAGNRVAARLADDPRVVARLTGATVVEEVEAILLQLATALRGLRRPLRFTVLYHHSDKDGVTVSRLNPFPDLSQYAAHHAYPPRLNLEPIHFLEQLGEHYLFAALHELFYSALLAENERRIQHMEGALSRLEERSARLVRDRNRLRQEEITEEIEVIMLSAEAIN
ncbi:MAG: F0F1 ATP synthase subunit gamma [Betaproteobacteria bacterium]|nr:F0F1 ATP synthase subunit gamma [Betaproteobacteria bacterium]